MQEGGEEGGIEHAWNIDEVDSTQAQRKKEKGENKTQVNPCSHAGQAD